MGFFSNLTIDYSRLRRIPIRDRVTLASSAAGSDIFGNLSPTEIAKLFPSYYLNKVDAGAFSTVSGGGGGAAAGLSTVPSGGGKSYTGGATGGGGGSGTAAPAGPTKPVTPDVIQTILERGGYNGEPSGAGNFTARERATLDLIAEREGARDPNIIFGGERYKVQLGLDQVPLTERTIADVINNIMPRLRQLSKADGYGVMNGRVVGTSAVGTGQMVEGTLKANLRYLGIPEEDWDKIKFDKVLQERLTLANFKTSGIGDPNDPSSWDYQKLAQQYESLAQRAITRDEIARIESASADVVQGENLPGTTPPDKQPNENETGIDPLKQPFDESMLDIDPRLRQYWSTATEAEKKALMRGIEDMGRDELKKHFEEHPGRSAESIGMDIASGSKFSVAGGNLEGVNPKLINVINAASSDLPEGYQVKMISGKDARGTGTKNHPGGIAMDVQIYNDKGELLPYDRNSQYWKEYEKLYRSVHIRGKEMYPDDQFIWGGAWISDAAGRGDPMHYQIVDPSIPGTSKTSGRYSFDEGLSPDHPFVQEGGQLTVEERQYYDQMVRDKIAKEKQDKLEAQTKAVAQPPLPGTESPPAPAPTQPSETGITPLEKPATAAPAPEEPKKMATGGVDTMPNNDASENISIMKDGKEIQVRPDEEVSMAQNQIDVKNPAKTQIEKTREANKAPDPLSQFKMRATPTREPMGVYGEELISQNTLTPSAARHAYGVRENYNFEDSQGDKVAV